MIVERFFAGYLSFIYTCRYIVQPPAFTVFFLELIHKITNRGTKLQLCDLQGLNSVLLWWNALLPSIFQGRFLE